MTEPPYVAGQFVWCMFPFSDAPNVPGPKRHVGYVFETVQRSDRPFAAVTLYTTTTPWPRGTPLPVGVIPIRDEHAKKLSQQDFVIDARRIAVIPMTDAFFPDLHRPDKGIQGEATPGLMRKIETVMIDLVKRPELLEWLGPEVSARNPRTGKPDRR